jgi:PAS domain S-box-containing protein
VNSVRAGWRKLQTYWHKLAISHRGSLAEHPLCGIAICIPLACLISSVVADGLLRQRTIELQQETERTNRILATSQSVLTSLVDAETGVHNYYIGNQKIFLKPYNSTVTTLESKLASLGRLGRNRPNQEAQKIQRIAQLARVRIRLLQQSIQRLESTKTVESAKIAALLLAGTREQERCQAEIGRFATAERRLLAVRTRSLQDDRQLLANVMSGGMNIGILCSIIAIRMLRKLSIELRQQELHLNESRTLVESIVANIIDGVAIVTPQGEVESMNNAAIEMFGYALDEVVGGNWQQLVAQEADLTQSLLLQLPDLLDNAMPTGRNLQAMGRRKNGDWFPIEFSINSIAADDEPIAMLGNRIIIIRDITARQQTAAILSAKNAHLRDLNQAFDATNRSLLETNRELDQFAYITAHDLKAPLRAISSLSTWIEEDLDEQIQPETRSQMHLLRSRIDRLQALLDSLLEYSRAGRLQTPISRVDVNGLIARAIDILAPPATFTVNILTPLPIFATCQQPLQQVFVHLIDNAIRHHPTKVGLVEISAVDLGDRYEFTIADDGEGIAPQYHNRIYIIFQTLKARDLEENVGAGLAIVKKIIEAQGGTIQLESSVGQGASFKFTWLKKHPIVARNMTINRSPRA